MGHGTQISGIQRDITGGMTRVNGVQRKITKGLTRVGGVQREISFGPSICTITMTGGSWSGRCYVKINGKNYNSDQTIDVPVGTEVCFSVGAAFAVDGLDIKNAITLNGVAVATVISDYAGEYTHIITKNITATSVKDGFLTRIDIVE